MKLVDGRTNPELIRRPTSLICSTFQLRRDAYARRNRRGRSKQLSRRLVSRCASNLCGGASIGNTKTWYRWWNTDIDIRRWVGGFCICKLDEYSFCCQHWLGN